MGTYVIGDIHGQYYALRALLDKLDIEHDEIYFLGDYTDWGKYSIKTLLYIIKLTEEHRNIHCIIGNHDKMMYDCVKTKLGQKLTLLGATNWSQNGGYGTMKQFRRLSEEKQDKIIKWLSKLEYSKEVIVNNRKYYLAHAYPLVKKTKSNMYHDAIWRRVKSGENPFKDMEKKYVDYTLICGHTISNRFTHGSFEVFFEDKFIILDCGAKVLNKYPKRARVAAIRLENLQPIYIDCIDANDWRWNNLKEWS